MGQYACYFVKLFGIVTKRGAVKLFGIVTKRGAFNL